MAVTNNRQQADTGTKMIHIGKNTRSHDRLQGHLRRHGADSTYRGLVRVLKSAEGARNYTQCDSLLIGDKCGAHTFPYIEVRNRTANVEHEATTSQDQRRPAVLLPQRGIPEEDAVSLIVNGFCKRGVRASCRWSSRSRRKKLARWQVDALEGSGAAEAPPGASRKSDRDEIACSRSRTSTSRSTASEILEGPLRSSVGAGEVHAIMGPNGSGKSTLAYVLAGREGYEVTGGSVTFDGKDLLAMEPEERAAAGVFLAFQYPVEIPGVANMYFLRAGHERACARRAARPSSTPPSSSSSLREKAKVVGIERRAAASATLNEGFSGGEKKRNEILQMAMLEPRLAMLDETDSGLDIDALRDGGRRRQRAARPERAHDRHHPLPAPARLHRAGQRARAGAAGGSCAPAARSWRWSSKRTGYGGAAGAQAAAVPAGA